MAPAYYFIFFAFIISLLMGFIVLPNVLVISHKHHLYDLPDDRKIHTIPIPRLGGVIFFPIITITIALLMGTRYFLGYDIIYISERSVLIELLFLLCGSSMLYILGVKDDLVGVSYKWKFLVQILCGILLTLAGLWIHDGYGLLGINHIRARFGYPITIFLVVYIINAFNMIDGLDGLASGLASVSLITFAFIFIQEKQLIYVLISISTLGVVLPFGIYNIFGNRMKGNKVFMGDTGTLTLGLILSFLLLRIYYTDSETNHIHNYYLIAFSSLIVPLFDVVRVFYLRIINHHNPFLPDRNHIHHKLLKTGMNCREVTLTIISLSVLMIILNMWLSIYLDINYIVCLDIIIMFVFHSIARSVIKRKGNRRH